MLLVGCGSASTQATKDDGKATKTEASGEKLKVGFIYIGSASDGGYSQAHDNGRKYLEEKIPNVETIVKESVPEGQEVEKVATDMIDQGAKVIFATSFGYMDYIEKVSKEYPDVKFFHCSGYKTTDNMSTYFGREYQARYLTGIVAGMKSKNGKIGYVAAFPIPEVVRATNAFALGVRSVNPNAVVKVTWTNTWYDPAKEKEAAISLLDQGVDVIGQYQDTTAAQQAAEERGAFSIGSDLDMSASAPKANMTSAVWNWGTYYVEAVKTVMDGKFKSESYWGGIDTGIVDIAPLTKNAPEGAQAKVDEAKAKMVSKSWDVFTGPIKDQSGAVKVAEGQKMTDKELLSFDWLVEGVEGQISK
ncbi:BMP family ABC transporter substrate-binding protein [Clostridium chromiireducens]|uniref:BMP family ABC transporter substrate-binding protein n=2 Tax=Clostridium chromiireducens TaxID=225345 RepID=A0A399IJH2_9CLOT|nr:BMP family ABC transporter substrate-binding protein [Clostridium chromiireducens]RII32607.1 BMP family ABC transporter substrate-binding protein [Clostridium chromiireducens]